MCIIVAKEKGKKLPSKETLETCFNRNNDGAGLMYVQNGKVVIDKGYMDFKSFYKRIKKLQKRFKSDLTDKAIVMHFRIGTSGENDKATTHPFPISSNSEDLRKTYFKTDLGMAHNGVIYDYVYGKELSDTQNFVKDFVSVLKELDNKFLLNKRVIELLDKECGSKLCFLDNKENIYYIGDFIEDEGVKYSNSTYKKVVYSTTPSYKYGCYDYSNYYDDYYEDYDPNKWKEYKPTLTTLKDVKTVEDFVKRGVEYEMLETGDKYELSDGTLEEVRDKDIMFLDIDNNLWEVIDNNVSLIGSEVGVYDKNNNWKLFYWDWEY